MVATGTPEQVAGSSASHTGSYLARLLEQRPVKPARKAAKSRVARSTAAAVS